MQTRFHAIGKQSYIRLGLIFLAWTAYGVFFASQSIIRRGISRGFADLPRHLVPWLLCAYCWAILTPVVLRLASRFPFTKGRFVKAFVVHIPAAVVLSLMQLGLYSAVATLISGSGVNRAIGLYRELVVEEFHQSVLVYALIIAIYSAHQFLFRASQDSAVEVVAEQPASVPVEYLSRVSIKVNGRIVLLNIEDVEWITSEGNYVSLHSKGKAYLLRETMDRIEKKLDPVAFVRLRRSTIVRIDQIQELHPTSKGEFEVILKDATRLSSTRRYRKNLQSALKV
ncbi:MAG TPA: LytTR family DNA-binding domain-containing protein [Pyrinomonadaceae bacterium]|nr:LytTR family DNA-binding domain-containing protein [Pyrinomonadaceae bacterium]